MQKFFLSFLLILTTMISAEKVKIDSNLLGGWKEQKVEVCMEVFQRFSKEYKDFEFHYIDSCRTQVVNGINYRMNLINEDHRISNCLVTINESFDKQKLFVMKNFHAEQDCFFFENEEEY